MKKIDCSIITADDAKKATILQYAHCVDVLDWKEKHIKNSSEFERLLANAKIPEPPNAPSHKTSIFLKDNSFDSLKEGAIWLVDGAWLIIKGLARCSTWALVIMIEGIVHMAKWVLQKDKKNNDKDNKKVNIAGDRNNRR